MTLMFPHSRIANERKKAPEMSFIFKHKKYLIKKCHIYRHNIYIYSPASFYSSSRSLFFEYLISLAGQTKMHCKATTESAPSEI